MTRPTWDEYFATVVEAIAKRSTCPRLSVGCVIVKDNNILATGYNGSVINTDHCVDEGCLMEDGHCVRTIHAEENAIIQCAKNGISPIGATAYVTHQPCFNCTKTLVQAGIKEIKYLNPYRENPNSTELLLRNGIRVKQLNTTKENGKNE